MPHPSYPAARAVVPKVLERLRRLQAEAPDGEATPIPDADVLETAIDAAFWASLRREEGYSPKISLAMLPPSQAPHPLIFERPLPLVAAALSRLAPAVERPGIHLGVWGEDARSLRVWGTMWTVPPRCAVFEVVAPGLLVVKHRRADESSKFANLAVLEGDLVKVLDQRVPVDPDCPKVVSSLFGFESAVAWVDSADVLVQFAVSMRAHGRGGTLLVVPSDRDTWRESILRPVPYAVRPPFSELGGLAAQVPHDAEEAHHWHERIARAVEALAGLTAVDGATVISDRYDLLAFGAKITRRDGHPPIDHLLLSEPVEGAVPTIVHPVQLGGTRHLSAAQFVQDQRGAVALVASQDGRFTVFTWSTAKELVHARRVEALLL